MYWVATSYLSVSAVWQESGSLVFHFEELKMAAPEQRMTEYV
jgi:hypothetical protein